MTVPVKARKRECTEDMFVEISGKYSLLSVSDSDEDAELNIATLPSLIIRKIIKMELESVQTMKLISPRWYALASDLLKHGHLQAGIKLFQWQRDFHGNTTLTVQVPWKYTSFFELESWRINRPPRRYDPECLVEMVAVFLPSISESKLHERITAFLKLCSRIEKIVVNINFHDSRKEIEVIREALKNVFIEELIFNGVLYFNENKYSFLDLIQKNTVCTMTISIFDITRIQFGRFFSKAVRSVSKIDLKLNRLTPFWDLARAESPWRDAVKLLNKDTKIKAWLDTLRNTSGNAQIQFTVKMRDEKSDDSDDESK